MTDVVWQAFIAAVVTVILAWANLRTKRAVEDTARDAARKVEIVKATLDSVTQKTERKLDNIAKVTEATHLLCNSAMMEQKRLLALTSRAKWQATRDAADLAAAEHAERMYEDHKARQHTIDQGNEPPK